MYDCREQCQPLCPGRVRYFVIMGLSGKRKVKSAQMYQRLNRPTSGEILINGEDIAGIPMERLRSLRRKELAMVFQHFGLLPPLYCIAKYRFRT